MTEGLTAAAKTKTDPPSNPITLHFSITQCTYFYYYYYLDHTYASFQPTTLPFLSSSLIQHIINSTWTINEPMEKDRGSMSRAYFKAI